MSINHENIQQNTRQTLKASGRISSADREDIPHIWQTGESKIRRECI